MDTSPIEFWFDYVDPASWLLELELERILSNSEAEGSGAPAPEVRRRPLEVVPPPRSLLDPARDPWRAHFGSMEEEARRRGIPLVSPALVPWTRKAHELAFHAAEKGCFPAVHRAIFSGLFRGSRDIGRVDVLVAIAGENGLDRSEVRAVLDVDRFAAAVEAEREVAATRGIRGVPTLVRGRGRLEGLPSEADLEAFLLTGG